METNIKQEENFNNNDLTLFQKIALEGEVCACYESASHDADKEFNTYILCSSSPLKYKSLFKAEILKYIDEEIYNKCNRYAIQNMFPVSILVDKIVSDLKYYSGQAENNLKDKVLKIPKPILKSKFVSFMRVLPDLVPSIGKEITLAIMKDDSGQLDFLKDVAFSFFNEMIDKTDNVTDPLYITKIFQTSIIEYLSLSFMAETDSLNQKKKKTKEIDEKEINNLMTALLGGSKRNEGVKITYVVKKIDKANKKVVMTESFDNQTEALKYVKSIKDNYPDLLDRYQFIIVKQEG